MLLGVVGVLFAALFCALYSKLNESLDYEISVRLFYQFMIAIPLVYFLLGNIQMADIISITLIGWVHILALVLIVSLGGYGFNILSIKKIGALKTGTLDYIEPMVGISLAILIFDESMSALQVIGWAIILFTLINIKRI